jgi:signal transduction histidine kinase
LAAIDGALERLRPQLYAALIFSLIAIAAGGVYISSNVSRLLGEIEDVAASITQGNYKQRARVISQDEIGRLTMTINGMAAQLDALSQAKAQFFGKVSHELRTPLTIIKGFAVTLLRVQGLSPQIKRQVDIINKQTDNLTRLVDDMLELARLDIQQLYLNCEPINMAEIAAEVVSSYQLLAEESGVTLRLHQESGPFDVFADGQRMKQVLGGLLDNAFKHSQAGDEIGVNLDSQDGRALISIEDTGPGIPAESLPHVFERFYQADPVRGGMGLGLAIAKELVEAHQGTIAASNRAEGGCCITVSLPCVPPTPLSLPFANGLTEAIPV